MLAHHSAMPSINDERDRVSGAGRSTPTISAIVDRKTLVELLYDPFDKRTMFAVADEHGEWRIADNVDGQAGEHLVPYRADNNLIKHGVVLFPSEPEEYGSTEELITDIRAYIHRYVDLSERFELIAAHYIVLSWVYDRFNELPYLRLRGEFGSGKTRFLLTVGSICRTPIFASGASSVAPLFHLLDRFRGTLLLDEADFRFSDAKAEIAKILNNGNAKGFPVLRCETKDGKEFNPRAFQVFGPKVIAMRGQFEDQALESRFITETTGARTLRSDIPINLPEEQHWEALRLRNKLLAFRFRNYRRFDSASMSFDSELEPRLNQILSPLAAVMTDKEARRALKLVARDADDHLQSERSASLEAQLLTIVRLLSETDAKTGIAIKEITDVFNRSFGKDFPRKATAKWIGGIIRRRLNLKTEKSNGVFIVAPAEQAKLRTLYERYGVTDEDVDALAREPRVLSGELIVRRDQNGDMGDFGDVARLPVIR
jgi:hypothetical protein